MKIFPLMPLVAMFNCANAMAFGPARVKVPTDLAAFTPMDQAGQSALMEIQKRKWERSKVVTLAADSPHWRTQILVRQTARISLNGNVLEIQSSAGESSLDGSMFAGATNDYSSKTFNAPVVYTSESVFANGTVQIAIGVNYKDGNAVDKNANKISLTMYKDEMFSGPDTYRWNDKVPDFDHAYSEQLVQFVILSWNKNSPAALNIRGISHSDSTEIQFVTSYSEKAATNLE